MKFISSRAALLAAAHVIPRSGLRLKDAPDLEELLVKHTEKVRTILEGFKGETDEVKAKQAELSAVLTEVEQRMARRGSAGGDMGFGGGSSQGWGAQFIAQKASEVAAIANERGKVGLQLKATITSATTDAAGSAGDLMIPQGDRLIGMPQRRMTVRGLLGVIPVESGSVEYPQQVGRTNNAATVAEGNTKPQSDLQFDLKNVPIRTIAHWMLASRQILSDAPQLAGLIETELLYGLSLVEETQLLKGDGTGQNLLGMIPQAAAYAAPAGLVDDNMIDQIGIAILQCSLTDVPPDGIVIHPADWWRMRLLKDGEGKYVLGDPGQVVPPSLFGLPVVPTQAMTVDKFLVGAFKQQTLYDRWEARVETSTEDSDNFRKNLVTLLGEERIGFAAKRPEALIYGDFGNVSE